MIWNSVHDMKDSGRLISKQFIIVMFIAQHRHKHISIDQGKKKDRIPCKQIFTDKLLF